jgi:hypothetical protein
MAIAKKKKKTAAAVHRKASAPRPKRQPKPRMRSAGHDDERVRARAFEIYTQRMGTGEPGDSVSDWLKAEQEIRRRKPKSK